MTERILLHRLAYLRWKRSLHVRCKILLGGLSGVPSFLFFGLLSILISPFILLYAAPVGAYNRISRRLSPSCSATERQQEQIARDPETSPDQLRQLIATLRFPRLGIIRGTPA